MTLLPDRSIRLFCFFLLVNLVKIRSYVAAQNHMEREAASTCASEEEESSYFQHEPLGLQNEPSLPMKLEYLHYNFPRREDVRDQLPTELQPPDFVRVYHYNHNGTLSASDLQQMAQEAKQEIRHHLRTHGAMLFRNLPLNAAKFANFIEDLSWPPFRRMDPFFARHQMQGLDLAPRAFPQQLIGIHNEQTYNPTAPEKVVFYCLQPATKGGGETLLARNDLLTQHIPAWVWNYWQNELGGHVVYHEWVLYDRNYAPDDGDRAAKSWQLKTGKENLDDALQVLWDFGFNQSGLVIDKQGTLFLSNNHTNVFHDVAPDGSTQTLWLDSILFDKARQPNGERLPDRLYRAVELAEWQSISTFLLQRGDFLVLDNLRVAHGRLPYQDGPRATRRLLTTYA